MLTIDFHYDFRQNKLKTEARHEGGAMSNKSVADLAAVWAEANCPDRRMRRDFNNAVTQAVEANGNVSLAIGWKLTKTGKPYLVYIFAGNFFAFALTPWQAANLKIAPGGMIRTDLSHSLPALRELDHAFSINSLEIDNARQVDVSAPLTGRLCYERFSECHRAIAIAMEFSLVRRVPFAFLLPARLSLHVLGGIGPN